MSGGRQARPVGVRGQEVRRPPAQQLGRRAARRPVLAEERARGDLHERPAADDVAHAVGRALDGVRALGVGQHAAVAADLQVAQDLGQAERPAVERHLQQQPARRRRGSRPRRSWSLSSGSRSRRDLGRPGGSPAGSPRPAAPRAARHAGPTPGGSMWVARVHVGRAHHRPRPGLEGRPAPSPRRPDGGGPSSIPGSRWLWRSITVRAQVDACAVPRPPGSDAAPRSRYIPRSPRGISSAGRAPGSHPGGRRFDSAMLHLCPKACDLQAFPPPGRPRAPPGSTGVEGGAVANAGQPSIGSHDATRGCPARVSGSTPDELPRAGLEIAS